MLEEQISSSVAFRYWVISLVVLFFKMYSNSLLQGIFRFKSKTFVRPEDAKVFGGGVAASTKDDPMADIASKCWRNDLENIPVYLFLSLTFVLIGGRADYALYYFSAFTLARIAHTIFYLKPMQPHRNIAYQVGTFVNVALAIHSCLLIFDR